MDDDVARGAPGAALADAARAVRERRAGRDDDYDDDDATATTTDASGTSVARATANSNAATCARASTARGSAEKSDARNCLLYTSPSPRDRG